MSVKIGIISLGCDKNRVDTENLLAYASDAGIEITSDENEADVIVINTCAFIKSSQQEAIDTILEFVEKKKERDFKIIVTGCLPERYKQEIVDAIPEVDAYLGISEYSKIADVINNVIKGKKVVDFTPCDVPTTKRVLTTPYHYAYLKIAEGCDNHCTYCAIPKIRGKFRSRTVESLVYEAKMLVEEYGVKELNIVAQDITRYGIDLYNEYALLKLLDKITALDVSWVRLLYCYPELLGDDLISFIAKNDKICKYVDIPLQHVDDAILKTMGRRTSEKEIKTLIEKIRSAGDVAIRSTFIVGFPGETDEQYQKLFDFIKEYKLNYAGFFAYSKEEGTPAEKLKNQIPKAVKSKRLKNITALQSQVIFENNKNYVGKTLKVLYEGIDYDNNLFFGRPEFCAPDVDAKVLFKSRDLVNIGNFYDVTITGSKGYDLIGDVK